jgi:preprotein translocase subunit SecF
MKFSIVKRAYLWISLGLAVMIASIVLFFTNLNLSKDFTGGIEIKIAQVLPKDKIQTDIENILKQNGIQKAQIGVHIENNITNILIKVNVNDTETSKLTDALKKMLLEKYLNGDKDKILLLSVV